MASVPGTSRSGGHWGLGAKVRTPTVAPCCPPCAGGGAGLQWGDGCQPWDGSKLLQWGTGPWGRGVGGAGLASRRGEGCDGQQRSALGRDYLLLPCLTPAVGCAGCGAQRCHGQKGGAWGCCGSRWVSAGGTGGLEASVLLCHLPAASQPAGRSPKLLLWLPDPARGGRPGRAEGPVGWHGWAGEAGAGAWAGAGLTRGANVGLGPEGQGAGSVGAGAAAHAASLPSLRPGAWQRPAHPAAAAVSPACRAGPPRQGKPGETRPTGGRGQERAARLRWVISRRGLAVAAALPRRLCALVPNLSCCRAPRLLAAFPEGASELCGGGQPPNSLLPRSTHLGVLEGPGHAVGSALPQLLRRGPFAAHAAISSCSPCTAS